MSMSLLTLFQFLGTLFGYLFITMALPCAVLRRKLCRYRFMDRVLLYFIIGNFYAINLVLLLELLHISHYVTIVIGLLVIPWVIWLRLNNYPLDDVINTFGHSFGKFLKGSMGFKSAAGSLWKKGRKRFAAVMKKVGESIRRDWPDWLLTVTLIFMVIYVYGVRMESNFGYTASDVPVHLYWVNALSDNSLFVEGIYPLGMHAIIYLIHTLFGLDTYVVFRVFALVQCLAIHLMALLFLRLCCRSRFAAYTGIFLYTIGGYVLSINIVRYLSALPQENSMIYILPTAYFALSYFRERSSELREAAALKPVVASQQTEATDGPAELAAPEQPAAAKASKRPKRARRPQKGKKKVLETPSGVALAGLAMSFSLCLSTHTYGAIIAAIFCVGIGVGFIRWLIKPAFFTRLIAAALISVAVAALPMGIAYAEGTPFEDSFFWARNVIVNSMPVSPDGSQTTGAAGASGDSSSSVEEDAVSLLNKVQEGIKRYGRILWYQTGYWIESRVLGFTFKYSAFLGTYVRWSAVLRVMILFLAAAGIVLQLFKPMRQYGAMLLSAGVLMILMSVLFCSGSGLGLPKLMDTERTSVFYSYLLIVVIGFTVDVCLYMLTCLLGKRCNKDVLSFAVLAFLVAVMWQEGDFRTPLTGDGLETNEAVTCLTNIIATEDDYTWTIFSANDETQMVYEHGYHYELSTFLEQIELLSSEPVTVPTHTIYFFIEKIPVEYVYTYWGSGQSVSTKGAQKALPLSTADDAYIGENRWIIMSRMYYWAQQFQRMYPNEMSVYMETDQFICYRLEQNTHRLFDLAIDYGYNSGVSEEL